MVSEQTAVHKLTQILDAAIEFIAIIAYVGFIRRGKQEIVKWLSRMAIKGFMGKRLTCPRASN